MAFFTSSGSGKSIALSSVLLPLMRIHKQNQGNSWKLFTVPGFWKEKAFVIGVLTLRNLLPSSHDWRNGGPGACSGPPFHACCRQILFFASREKAKRFRPVDDAAHTRRHTARGAGPSIAGGARKPDTRRSLGWSSVDFVRDPARWRADLRGESYGESRETKKLSKIGDESQNEMKWKWK
jgi:hypothetical protein